MQSTKPVHIFKDVLVTPPMPEAARIEAGQMLRRIQRGYFIEMPSSRPMPNIGPNCHELRIIGQQTWRVIYQIRTEAILVLVSFQKQTQATPLPIIRLSQQRIARYESGSP